MRLHCVLMAGVVALSALAGAGRAAAPKPPPAPLRRIPAEADFVIQLREPRRAADLVRKLQLLTQLQQLPFVKSQLDSTSARRAAQLLAYFEGKMGDRWPGLLARLAGGGAALAGKYGDKAPALLVIQGDDEKLTRQFVGLAVELLEAELARQESKQKVVRHSADGVDAYQVGDEAFLARLGAAVVVSNNKDALGRAVALYRGKRAGSLADHAPLREAAKLLPDRPLLDAYFDLGPAQRSAAGKQLYQTPRDNGALTLAFGGYLDVLGRAPFLTASLSQEEGGGYLLSLRAPRGREGMGSDLALHLPPDGQAGCRPLLEPRGVLYSTSFYLDVARVWQDREKLFTRANADSLAQADKNSGRVLLGSKLSQVLEAAGARHRIVVANQSASGYKRSPKVTIPAFAVVTELRKPERFARLADLGLRAAALALTNQLGLELKEQTHRGVPIVGYRFDEAKELPDDTNDIRFAFSPCWARVGEQFVLSSTAELCRDLVDALQAEQKAAARPLDCKATDRTYGGGFAGLLLGIEDQLITQAILDQAIEPAEAKRQVRQLIELIRGLGDATSRSEFHARQWRYEVRFGK